MVSGQKQCVTCPPNTYAMLGASKCLPLPNCTDDDIITAPGDLSTCSCQTSADDFKCTTTVYPNYVKVNGKSPPRDVTSHTLPTSPSPFLPPYRGSNISLAGCGIGHKIKVGCGIWELLREGYGMKITWRDRDALISIAWMRDSFEIDGGFGV